MKSVQIRDVPEAVVSALKRTATRRGESLQRYLLSVLSEQARIDTTATLLAEAAEDARKSGAIFDAAAWVRAARDERGDELAGKHGL